MKRSEKHNVVELRNVSKVFPTSEYVVNAVDSVNLEIPRGDFISIMGPSGSGKTTLLNLIGCLTKPTSGDVLIEGVDTKMLDDAQASKLRSETIGFIFQGYNLVPTLTALENVIIQVLFSKRRADGADVERAKQMLTRLGLAARMEQYSRRLSFGEQQRVAIARALMNDPELILADEPTGTLDTDHAKEVVGLLRRLNEEEGRTIVLVTHDPLVGSAAKTKYVLRDGRLHRTE